MGFELNLGKKVSVPNYYKKKRITAIFLKKIDAKGNIGVKK